VNDLPPDRSDSYTSAGFSGRSDVALVDDSGVFKMQIYDTIMLVVVAATAFLGWRKGMVSQVASIVSLIASFFVASNFYQEAATHVNAPSPWNQVAAFGGLYLGTSLIVWVFSKSIRSSVERMKLKDFDYQMGGLLGAIKGVGIACAITLVAVNLLTPNTSTPIVQSKSGGIVSRIVHTFGPFMPQRMQPFLVQYVQRLDEAIGTPGDPYGSPGQPTYPYAGQTGQPGAPYQVPGGYQPPTYQNPDPAPNSYPYGGAPSGTYGQSPQYVPPTSPPSWPNIPENAGQPNDGFRY
jgi:membrane protein required for colicin V production